MERLDAHENGRLCQTSLRAVITYGDLVNVSAMGISFGRHRRA
jgi:hypothetical protein